MDFVKTRTPSLDAQQVHRIEGVHRGFLYQHLFTVAWLLMAKNVGANSIIVEQDEDLEIVFPDHRLYIQIKSRSAPLRFSDIKSAMERFDALRIEHEEERRQGAASFVVAANVTPGPGLLARLQSTDWPSDVSILWPDNHQCSERVPIAPQSDINSAFGQCADLAASLPYLLLAPETLVWKLAGCVMAAAAGNPPRVNHTFLTTELTQLFEQVVVQLQDFPEPPLIYRPHVSDPPLRSAERVRIITGYSGSGKTSWASQIAIHATDTATYFDVVDKPGPALASTLARELAARLFGRSGGPLGEILLPGATGPEILQAIGTRLAANGKEATIVLDNAHRIPTDDMLTLIQHGNQLKFILLCRPAYHVQELEARLSIKTEYLRGWSSDTIALEVDNRRCRANYAACERLSSLTAGIPLYVQNALAITESEYNGSVSRFCDDLEAKTHLTETVQESILSHIFDSFSAEIRDVIGALSFADIPIDRVDVTSLLEKLLKLDNRSVAAVLRQIRSHGCMEVFGGDHLKIHDAIRLLGQAHVQKAGNLYRTQIALKEILAASLKRNWELPKLFLYLRMLTAVGDIKTLVQLVTDELFHELGTQTEIMTFLDKAAISKDLNPNDRFWALDGLTFSAFKQGDLEKAAEHLEVMAHLVKDHMLGVDEVLALSMKRMNILAAENDVDGVLNLVREISQLIPDTPEYQRIFRYNVAHALFFLRRYEETVEETFELIQEYYDTIGIGPEDVIGNNPDKIWPLLKKSPDLSDHLKHLADCLDLNATALNASGHESPFGRIHAMKFYQMANAFDSLIRVGQDLVDELVGRNDFVGAKQFIETNLLPNVKELKLLTKVIPVRSQYAVILAYCGEFDAAESEMERLAPYEAGLDEDGQKELQRQREGIAKLRLKGPPPQWIPDKTDIATIRRRKIGRNQPCPCGSGKKYKKCCGR